MKEGRGEALGVVNKEDVRNASIHGMPYLQ